METSRLSGTQIYYFTCYTSLSQCVLPLQIFLQQSSKCFWPQFYMYELPSINFLGFHRNVLEKLQNPVLATKRLILSSKSTFPDFREAAAETANHIQLGQPSHQALHKEGARYRLRSSGKDFFLPVSLLISCSSQHCPTPSFPWQWQFVEMEGVPD